MIKVVTGNEAAAYGALLAKPDVVCAYPITPQSRIPEQIAEFQAEGLFKGKFVNAESEMTSLTYVSGASSGGVRVFTATAAQGLAVMHEQLHNTAGSRLPIVMVNVNRPLMAPGNLTCDQIDSLSQRDTGWLQFYCESNQEILDSVIQAYKIAETISLPVMVCLDGVYLSYIFESIEIRDQAKVDQYLSTYRPMIRDKRKGTTNYRMWWKNEPDPNWPIRYYMGSRYEMQKAHDQAIEVVLQADKEFAALFGVSYPPVEGYRSDDADVVVVISGSAVGTCRHVIDMLRDEGYKVGMVKLRMFRPFPRDLVREALAGKEKIAIIERDLSPGIGGIFHQEIKGALNIPGKVSPPIYGFIAGLGGEDITTDLIKKALLFTIENNPVDEDVIWLGLMERKVTDDYDKKSLQVSSMPLRPIRFGRE